MYNPSADCGDESHTRSELYQKLHARNQTLGADRVTYPHLLPDPTGHYGTLFGNYEGKLDQKMVDDEMRRVKLKKRSGIPLDQWAHHKIADKFERMRNGFLYEINQVEKNYVNETTAPNGILSIDRFHYKDVSYEWFVKNYEQAEEPCMISGFTDDWPLHQWTIESMNNSFLAQEEVKVGKDSSGRRIGVRFDIYAQYLKDTKDDSAVYLFESQIDRNANLTKIFDSYTLPVWFAKDLFNYCHPERRPPHRWFCIGKKGSGTTMHTDPFGCAWNSVIAGRKLWIIFGPAIPEDVATGKIFMDKMPKTPNQPNILNEAVGWFHQVWPQLRNYMIDNNLSQEYRPRLFIQYPGETIFVPGGLQHFVLNLDDCLAVTQNYCNMSNFGLCWRQMRIERPHTAIRWLAMLKRRYPLAYKCAQQLDQQDKFTIPLNSPHVQGKHNKFIAELKTKAAANQDLTPEEKTAIEKYDAARAEDKVWAETEGPFLYDEEWKYWSGSTDSSTQSSDDEEEEEEEDEEEAGDEENKTKAEEGPE